MRTKKDQRQSFRLAANAMFKVKQVAGQRFGHVTLPKTTPVKFRSHRIMPTTPTSVTVFRDNQNRWFVSFVADVPSTPTIDQPAHLNAPAHHDSEGITTISFCGRDKLLVGYSDGRTEEITVPSLVQSRRSRAARLAGDAHRKQVGSANHAKAVMAARKAQNRAVNTERDYWNKMALRLIGSASTIVVPMFGGTSKLRSKGSSLYSVWGYLFDRIVASSETSGVKVVRVGYPIRPGHLVDPAEFSLAA